MICLLRRNRSTCIFFRFFCFTNWFFFRCRFLFFFLFFTIRFVFIIIIFFYNYIFLNYKPKKYLIIYLLPLVSFVCFSVKNFHLVHHYRFLLLFHFLNKKFNSLFSILDFYHGSTLLIDSLYFPYHQK